MKLKKPSTAPGRPRQFDTDQALDRAMELFWEKGYEGTSLTDLTTAMGINRPSLYAAFGNKEALFRKALDRYAGGPAGYVEQALALPTAREVVEALLLGGAELLTSREHPRGCLVVQSALVCGQSSDPIRQELAARRTAAQTAMRQRFKRAMAEKDLPPDVDPADLARYVATVIHGMAVQAASGANRNELKRVAALALRAWPV